MGTLVVPVPGGAGRLYESGDGAENEKELATLPRPDVEQPKPPANSEDPPRLTARTKYLIYAAVTMYMLGLHFPRPMLPGMCRDMYNYQADDVGYCNGAMLATVQVGSFLSAFILGHCSDVLGRRPVLLLSIAATVATLGSLGSLDIYGLALANRFLAGFLDGTLPATKGYVADVSQGAERASVLSFYGGLFALSRTLSILLAGLLSVPKWVDPADTADWDWVSPHNYPSPEAAKRVHATSDSEYALIYAMGAVPYVALFVAVYIGLPESRRRDELASRPATPAAALSAFRSTLGSLWRGLGAVARDGVLLRLNTIYFLQAFSYGGSMLGLVLYPLAPKHSRGLAFTPFAVGVAWAYNGLVGFFYRLFVVDRLLARYGLRRLYQAGLLCFTSGCLCLVLEAMPFTLGLSTDRRPWALSYAVLLLASTFFGLGWIMGFPMLGAMLSQAAGKEVQGLVQGVAESLAAFAKAAAPGLLGALFSASLRAGAPQLIFVAEFVIYASCFFISLTIPRHVGAPTGLAPAPSGPAPPAPSSPPPPALAGPAPRAPGTFPRRAAPPADDLREAQAQARAMRDRMLAEAGPAPAGPAGGAGVALPAASYPARSDELPGARRPAPEAAVALPPSHVWTTPGRKGG